MPDPVDLPTAKRNRGLFILLAASAVLVPLIIGCDALKNRPSGHRILILCQNPDFEGIADGFKAQMAELGYVEGRSISYEQLDLDSFKAARARGSGERSVAERVDLVFSLITGVTLAAKEALAGTGTPLLFAYAGIEGAPLVESIRRPGGLVTGVRFPGPEQISKRLEILYQIAPLHTRILIVYRADYPNSKPALEMLRTLARPLPVRLVEVPVVDVAQVRTDLEKRDRSADPGVDAVLLMPDDINHSPTGWQLLRDFAHRHNLPLAGSFRYTVAQGAIFGNANDLTEVGRLAAPLAHKIFQGIDAGSLPVVTPEQELYINYRRIMELGLDVPEGLLRQAKEIVR